MIENELDPKPIGELLEENFFIPAYQRGYRWSKRQVLELLDDIKEFQQTSEGDPKEAFYCLQPIVVKKKGDEWELVDGQQRLTTIYIILNYLKDIAALLGKGCYGLRYETRPGSADFLKNFDQSRKDENIDFYHICEARDAIEEWFDAQDGAYRIRFLQTLISDNETGKNVKVIWYQINQDVDATAVFSRLNMGKIPLSNAELVKALFLKSSNFTGSDELSKHLQQLKIAHEWDSMEKQLQNDEFWYFLSNDNVESNRIEKVLQLAALSFSSIKKNPQDSHAIFLAFNERLAQKDILVEDEWLHVKKHFMILQEWFNDHELYHLVGFLICQNDSIEDLIQLNKQFETRKEFRSALAKRIYTKVFSKSNDVKEEIEDVLYHTIEEQLEELSYKGSRPKLVAVLLLFNISSLLANPTTRAKFQFNRFKYEKWDIEHIRSVTSEMPKSTEKQKSWVNNVVDYISTTEKSEEEQGSSDALQVISEEANTLLSGITFNTQLFEDLYNKIIDELDPNSNEEVDNGIGNLTLLDSSTNRSYQNAVFPIKRKIIISLDKKATFVPLCTKNVFLKYYSKKVDKMMFWEGQDSLDYQKAMLDMLYGFFKARGVKL